MAGKPTPLIELRQAQQGFGPDYPVGRTASNQILRPLKQPIYDMEILPIAGAAELLFYQRPQGQNTAFGAPAVTKTAAETNLTQSGQLSTPQQYKVAAFTVGLAAGVTLADFRQIYNTAVYEFSFTGNRIYLQIPLLQMPAGVAPEGFAATTVGATTLAEVHNGVGHPNDVYRFNLGRAMLHIQSTETFNVRLRWPNGAAAIVVQARVYSYVWGVIFAAI
jgi:hypothetical protein